MRGILPGTSASTRFHSPSIHPVPSLRAHRCWSATIALLRLSALSFGREDAFLFLNCCTNIFVVDEQVLLAIPAVHPDTGVFGVQDFVASLGLAVGPFLGCG